MAGEFSLAARPRQAGWPRRDRASGAVPAVMYGHGLDPQALAVDGRGFAALLARGGQHHLVEMAVEGEGERRHTVVVKEIQRHPVTRDVVHVDFQAVSASERIHSDVPLRLHGEDQIHKSGGVLQITLHALRISCLPADLPDHIDVDLSGLVIGRSLVVGDIAVPAGTTVANEPDEVICAVLAPRTTAAEDAPAAPAPADADKA